MKLKSRIQMLKTRGRGAAFWLRSGAGKCSPRGWQWLEFLTPKFVYAAAHTWRGCAKIRPQNKAGSRPQNKAAFSVFYLKSNRKASFRGLVLRPDSGLKMKPRSQLAGCIFGFKPRPQNDPSCARFWPETKPPPNQACGIFEQVSPLRISLHACF